VNVCGRGKERWIGHNVQRLKEERQERKWAAMSAIVSHLSSVLTYSSVVLRSSGNHGLILGMECLACFAGMFYDRWQK
jgi:hypothetical protein